MQHSKKRTAFVTGLAGLGVAGAVTAALIASPAQAEDPTPTPTPTASASAEPGRPDRAARAAERDADLAAALAKELGVDEAKVAAALEKVRAAEQSRAKADRQADLQERLDAAVKEGKLTAEQAEAIKKAAEAGVLPGGGFGRGHGGPPGGR